MKIISIIVFIALAIFVVFFLIDTIRKIVIKVKEKKARKVQKNNEDNTIK